MNEAEVFWKFDTQIAIIGARELGNIELKKIWWFTKRLFGKVDDSNFQNFIIHTTLRIWPEEVAHHTDVALPISGHTHGMQAGY